MRADIAAALDQVTAWFGQHELPVQRRELVDHAVVFADVADARRSLAAKLGGTPDQIPESFSGTVIERTLYVVAPAAYRATYQQLYPDHAWRPQEYRALIVHEVAHRAHALQATRLFGSEEGMGPGWFFEGLALVCAGQFDEPAPPLTRQELHDLIARGIPDFPAPQARVIHQLHFELQLHTTASLQTGAENAAIDMPPRPRVTPRLAWRAAVMTAQRRSIFSS